jgi:hypothetical protein
MIKRSQIIAYDGNRKQVWDTTDIAGPGST